MHRTQKARILTMLGLLSALLIILSFTPLGYLKIGILSITFNMIPVAIGAAAYGPSAGLVLGTVFGLTSFVQCFGADAFGVYLLGVNPFYTFLACVVARALAGFLTGLLCNSLPNRIRRKALGDSLTGLMASLCNTLFFLGCLLLLFGRSTLNDAAGGVLDASQNIILFFASFATFNAIWEAIAAFILTGAICTALRRAGLFSVKNA
jgi:uncharacterized membrane protein